MAVSAPVVIAKAASTANITLLAAPVTVATNSGDLVFITVHAGSDSTSISVSDSKGNSWQASTPSTTALSPPSTTRVFWSKLTTPLATTDTISVSRTPTGGITWIASVVSGASGVVTVGETPSGFSQTPSGSVTLSMSTGFLHVMAFTSREDIQLNQVGTGYTASDLSLSTGTGNPRGGGYIYQQVPSQGAATPSVTMALQAGWTAVIFAIEPTETPVEPTPRPYLVEWDGSTMTTLDLIEWDGTSATPLYLWGSARKTVAIIGDSNTYRNGPPPFTSRETVTRQRLINAGWGSADIYWYGAGGKAMLTADQYTKTTLQNINDAQAQLGTIDQLVIALGTNDVALSDTAFTNAMNTILDACESIGVGEVLWVNLAYKSSNNTNSTHFNPLISTAIANRSFARLIDWHTYIHTTDYDANDWITEDGTHYTVQGYAKRDAFIISKLTSPDIVNPSKPFMGGYLGTPGETPDERYLAAFGAHPAVASTYYQAYGNGGGSTINLAYEQARSGRGTIPLLTVTSVGGPYSMAQIADGTADTWIDYWRDNIAQIEGEVWFTFDHEFEVKLNQNKWLTPPTIAEYATAYNRFITRVKAGAPNVKSVYWYGYSDTTKIDQVGSLIDTPDLISFDPYVFSHHDGTTSFTDMVAPKINWLRSRSWYQDQPIFLAEYGIDSVHGDTNMAAFYTDLRTNMQNLGLAGAVLFCRDSTGDIMSDISNSNWPLAKAAYRASMLDI